MSDPAVSPKDSLGVSAEAEPDDTTTATKEVREEESPAADYEPTVPASILTRSQHKRMRDTALADEDDIPPPGPVPSRMSTPSTESRQKIQGLKRRRKTNDNYQRTIRELEASLSEETRRRQKAEDEVILLKRRIHQLEAKHETKDIKVEKNDDWLTSTYTLMSPAGKKDLKQSMIMAKETFTPGR